MAIDSYCNNLPSNNANNEFSLLFCSSSICLNNHNFLTLFNFSPVFLSFSLCSLYKFSLRLPVTSSHKTYC